MTTPSTPSPDHPRSGSLSSPPPGCPAHDLGPGTLQQLDGREAKADPMGFYEKLRAEHGAVAPVLMPGDLSAWLVLGHRENLEVMRSPFKFARNPSNWHVVQQGKLTAEHELAPILYPGPEPLCSHADGDEHRRLRGAVTESLERFNRRGMRGHVTRHAHQLIDAFSAKGRADLVSQFADQLPLRVMIRLLGMPEEHRPLMVKACRDMLEGTSTAVANNAYITNVLQQLVKQKRSTPGYDIASWLIAHDAQLSDESVCEHLRLILIAAYRTTAGLIASTVQTMLTDGRFRGNLAGGHMTLPDAIEQVLWDHSPFAVLPGRFATGDTELAGQRIKAGDILLLGLAAGNVDPDIRPDLSIPVHGNRSHLAFSGGPHECPGQDIGRSIAETGIDTLMTRLPDMRLAVPEDQLRWRITLMTRELIEIPVRFTPRQDKSTPHAAATEAGTAQPMPTQPTVPGKPKDPGGPPPSRSRSLTQQLLAWWKG